MSKKFDIEFAGERQNRAVLVGCWLLLATASLFWWAGFLYSDNFDGVPMLGSLVLLTTASVVLLVRTLLGKGWRVLLSTRSSWEQKRTVIILLLFWHRIARDTFKPVRIEDKCWVPGLHALYLDQEKTLQLEVQLPNAKVENRVLTEPAADGSFADAIPVEKVIYNGRKVGIARYTVIPTDLTDEVTVARFDD